MGHKQGEYISSSHFKVECYPEGRALLYPPVSVSYSFCNRLAQTECLKTTQNGFLLVLETRKPKSRCGQGQALSEGSPGESVPCCGIIGGISSLSLVPGTKIKKKILGISGVIVVLSYANEVTPWQGPYIALGRS